MVSRDLEIGESCIVEHVGGEGSLRQHFLDMGIIPGARVTLVKYAPMGDPMELRIHGFDLTLRLADAEKIEVRPADDDDAGHLVSSAKQEVPDVELSRPDYGEGAAGGEVPAALPEGATLTFALVGNQNCGKTTLFNQLTGANQHVGNFPGVTVDRKDGHIRGHDDTLITDLPGIYSFSPYTSEELVSRDFVMDEHPRGIVNIVDATNIERNLYLTMQCLEMGVPMVVALNMMDELTGNGGSVDINRMEWMLGVPVIPICAATGEGVEEVARHALHVARHQERPAQPVIDLPGEDDDCLRRCHQAIANVILKRAQAAQLPVRFAASKLIEGDESIAAKLALNEAESQAVKGIIRQMEDERGLDASAAIADMRFSLIFHICDTCVVKPHESKEHQKTSRIDCILTGKWTAIPCFVIIMLAVFLLTFNVIGGWLQERLAELIDMGSAAADVALSQAGVNEAVHGLIIDGIFAGVGSVLSFLPIILVMFLFLSLLEDSGYLARVAFFMDKPLRRIGLSGRSIVPLLVGFGCTVPAVMSARTLPSDRDRRMTILLTPFMSCTAKLPIYAFFVAAFFPGQGGLVMTALYFLGIALGILVAHVYCRTIFKGDPTPLVLELPNYRMPSLKNTGQLMWEKAKDFLQKAFSVILIATVIVWFLSHFDLTLNLLANEQADQSLLALIAGWLAPILDPVGLGDWRIGTSLISGFMAKESVVAVMEQLFAPVGGVPAALTTLQAASMLVFALLYTPCVAAIAAIKREMGAGWAVRVAVGMFAMAWVAALVVRLIGLALGIQ